MSRNLPAPRNVAVLSHRTQSPHDSGLRSFVCCRLPDLQRKKASASLPLTSHNTGRPRSAYGSHRTISFRSGYRAGYRVPPLLPRRCNVRRLSQPVQCLSPGSSAQAVDWPSAALGFHDPVIPRKSFLFQSSFHTFRQLFLPHHKVLLQDSAVPLPQGTHSAQWFHCDTAVILPYPHGVCNNTHPQTLWIQFSSGSDSPHYSQLTAPDGNNDPPHALPLCQIGSSVPRTPHSQGLDWYLLPSQPCKSQWHQTSLHGLWSLHCSCQALSLLQHILLFYSSHPEGKTLYAHGDG